MAFGALLALAWLMRARADEPQPVAKERSRRAGTASTGTAEPPEDNSGVPPTYGPPLPSWIPGVFPDATFILNQGPVVPPPKPVDPPPDPVQLPVLTALERALQRIRRQPKPVPQLIIPPVPSVPPVLINEPPDPPKKPEDPVIPPPDDRVTWRATADQIFKVEDWLSDVPMPSGGRAFWHMSDLWWFAYGPGAGAPGNEEALEMVQTWRRWMRATWSNPEIAIEDCFRMGAREYGE